MNDKWYNALKGYIFSSSEEIIYFCLCLTNLWKGILRKNYLKVYNLLARLLCCFWYSIIWSRISRAISIEEVKISHTSLIPNVKWLTLQLFAFSLNILFSWEWCWQLYNPFRILGQMKCHLNSRKRWEGRYGMRASCIFFITSSRGWIFSQYTRT